MSAIYKTFFKNVGAIINFFLIPKKIEILYIKSLLKLFEFFWIVILI